MKVRKRMAALCVAGALSAPMLAPAPASAQLLDLNLPNLLGVIGSGTGGLANLLRDAELLNCLAVLGQTSCVRGSEVRGDVISPFFPPFFPPVFNPPFFPPVVNPPFFPPVVNPPFFPPTFQHPGVQVPASGPIIVSNNNNNNNNNSASAAASAGPFGAHAN